MSYYIYLAAPTTGASMPLHRKPGEPDTGGAPRAHMEVSYRYSELHRKAFGNDHGLHSICGLTGTESLPVLNSAMAALGVDADPELWATTEGNAREILVRLHKMAGLAPDGVWRADST